MKELSRITCFATIVVNLFCAVYNMFCYIDTSDKDEMILAMLNLCIVGIILILLDKDNKESLWKRKNLQ